MFLLPGIRHGSHLVRRATRAHAMLLSAQTDLRHFSKAMTCRESLATTSIETLGSSPPEIRRPAPRKTRFKARLSQETEKILGLSVSGGMACFTYDNSGSYTARIEEAIKRRAVQEFDKTCKHSGQQRLSALAVATAHLGQILPPNLSMKLQMKPQVSPNKCLSIEAPGQHKSPLIRISLQSMHVPEVHAPGVPTSEGTPYRFTTVLNAAVHSEPQSTASTSSTLLPAEEEIIFLRSTSNMVLSRLCSDLQFESALAAFRTFAEALLRVLRFRTPYLSLESVKLVAGSTSRPGKEDYIVQATWRDSIDVVTSVEDAKKRQVDVEVINDGVVDQDDAGPAPQSDPNDLEVADSTASVKSTESSSWSRLILKETKYWCHLHPAAPGNLISELRPQRVVCEAAKRRFGTPFVVFRIKWDPEFLADLKFGSILNTIETALEAAENSSVTSLVCAVESVARTIPYVRAIDICLESDADSTYQRGTPRRTANLGTIFNVSTVGPSAENTSSKFNIYFPWIAVSASLHQGQDAGKQTMMMRTHFLWNSSDLSQWHEEDINDVAKSLHAHLYQASSSVASENDFASHYDVANAVQKAVRSSAPTLSRAASIRTRVMPTSPSHNAAVKSCMDSWVCSSASGHVEAFIALGSNVGNRLHTIEQACCALDNDQNIRILETSPLYETKAMYVEDQESFVNGVCKIQTDLPATQLLDRLQAIEDNLGRVKIIEKGPRNIDLDMLTYSDDVVRSERLTVPHALMHEREFVLRPMSDISGGSDRLLMPGKKGLTVLVGLHKLASSESPMYALTPLSPGSQPLRSLSPQRRTMIMSILNVTPDSFSDGGDNHNSDMEALRQTIATHIAEGATIIDIGGQSSRPNAPDITSEEEISRILPTIEAIKSLPEACNIAISIDTYRASVAEAAIKAGAHIINDISAGLLDPEMLPTIARLGCTYIMMHMRGTPATMQSEENTSYPNGLIPTIASELQSRLQAAQEAGIRRWRIILDPGVGFAKTTEQNAELLGKFSELRNWKGLATYPWLVGSSRKGFIGKLTGVTEAKDRVEGTAATVTAAVAGGAEIVRVHDVKEMARVVKMADAMYRSG